MKVLVIEAQWKIVSSVTGLAAVAVLEAVDGAARHLAVAQQEQAAAHDVVAREGAR